MNTIRIDASQKQTLLIVDHYDASPFTTLNRETEITVFPLGIVPALYQTEMKVALKRHGARVFPVEDVSDRALEKMRNHYPQFANQIIRQPIKNGVSLLQLLSLGKGSAWWFTDTAEKSPLRTPFLNQLYNLAIVDEVLSTCKWDEVRLSLTDPVLEETIESEIQKRRIPIETDRPPGPSLSQRKWQSRVKGSFWVRFLVLRVMLMVQTLGNRGALWLLGVGRPTPGKTPAALVFSRYPVLYSAPFSDAPRERNLGSLIPRLRRSGPVWQVVLLTLWPWQLLRRASEIRLAFAAEQILPLPIFNTMKEWFAVFFGPTLIFRLWRYWRLRPSLKADFCSWDVTPLWRAELDRNLTGPELLSNLLLVSAIQKLARRYSPASIIHPSEFQPMERAIWAGLKGTQTRSVAFQHSTVSSNALSYFFAEGEIQEALSGEDRLAAPLPDYYLTTGDWPLEVMRQAGYPANRSAVVGAVRYNELVVESQQNKSAIRRRLDLPAQGKIVLVTTSSDRADSTALLESLAACIPSLADSFLFLFRSHYHLRIDTEVEQMFAMLAPEYRRTIDVDINLHDYIRASDAVVLTNSTTGLEAIALGCPPVIFDIRAIVNIGPLGDLREAALFAHTPKGLAEALQAALDPTVLARLKAAWPAALSRTFHALDGHADKRFVAFLEERGLLSNEDAHLSCDSSSPRSG